MGPTLSGDVMCLPHTDITEQTKAIEDFRRTHEMLEAVIQSSPIGIITVNLEGNATSWNPAAERIHGWSRDEAIGRYLPELVLPESLWDETRPFHQGIVTGNIVSDIECRGTTKGGGAINVSLCGAPLHDASGNVAGAIYMVIDITARKLAEEQLHYQAFHDVVTGLTNRRFFNEHLDVQLAATRANRSRVGVFYIHLDSFDVVYETLGSSTGDALLAVAAVRLSESTGENGIPSWNGGKFTVIFPGVKDSSAAVELASKIRSGLQQPFQAGGREVFATVSIGISLFPDDAADTGELMRHADMAMNQARRPGGDRTVLYTAALGAEARERMDLENDLRGAWDRGEITIHYQPEFRVNPKRLICFEALARWNHSRLGPVPPLTFIPVAEASGLIIPLGLRILETACSRAAGWQNGAWPVKVAVNVSAIQFFNDDFVSSVRGVLERTGLAPDLLELELTESVLLPGAEQTVGKMRELRAMGVALSIDDFGTGYSSLSYLGKLPFTALKIDRSFVQDLNDGAYSGRMIETLVTLAHNFEMKVVVEGIETAAQYRAIAEFGCDEAQGYLLGRPDAFPERFLDQFGSNDLAMTNELIRLRAVLTKLDKALSGDAILSETVSSERTR